MVVCVLDETRCYGYTVLYFYMGTIVMTYVYLMAICWECRTRLSRPRWARLHTRLEDAN